MEPREHGRSKGQRYPVAEEPCQCGLYLPSGALTEAEFAYVCGAVREAREGGTRT